MITQKIMRRFFPNLTENDERIIHGLYSRNRMLPFSYNRVKGQGRGVLYVLYPYLQEVYKDDPEALLESYKRHNTYFICRFHLAPFITSILYHMEKEKAAGHSVADSSINDIKVSLMGPLSGIGDPLYQAVIPMIIAGITLGMATEGNILGPIIYLLLYLIINYGSYVFFAYFGYSLGTRLIDRLVSGGLMDKISKAASLLGLMMIGAICAQTMHISLNWAPTLGGAVINVQEQVLDAIMPNLLPIVSIFTVFALLRKKVSINKIIVGIFVLNIAMGLLGLY